MIPNQWYAIIESKKVKNKPVGIKRFGMNLVLWRNSNQKIVCMRDYCPHRGVKLSLGRVDSDKIRCGYHGFSFDSSGECQFIPCDNRSENISRALTCETFCVTECHDLIWFWWGKNLEEKPDVPWFDEVPSKPGLAHMSIVWPQNYARSIETNFDGSHFPFVHKSVLPGIGEHVSDIECFDKSDLGFSLKMKLTHLNESKSFFKKDFTFFSKFLLPNHSIISFGKYYGGLIIDTPIDDRHTWRYMRVAHFPFKNNFLRNVLGRVLIFLDWLFTQKLQDQPIIETMQPKEPLENAHHFVRADLGIAKYRQMRKQYLETSLAEFNDYPYFVRDELMRANRVFGVSPKKITLDVLNDEDNEKSKEMQ